MENSPFVMILVQISAESVKKSACVACQHALMSQRSNCLACVIVRIGFRMYWVKSMTYQRLPFNSTKR